jgi:hypothetical protein
MTAKNDQNPDPLDSGLARHFGFEYALRYNAGTESALRTMLIRNAGRKLFLTSCFKSGCFQIPAVLHTVRAGTLGKHLIFPLEKLTPSEIVYF